MGIEEEAGGGDEIRGGKHPNYGKRGKDVSSWKGGEIINSNGYALVLQRNHPNAHVDGYIYEHRLVMEKKLSM